MGVVAVPYDGGSAILDITMGLPYYHGGNHVIQGYLDELLVETSATAGKVKVNTGAAVVYGRVYTNDAALELSIAAAANNRIDLIVLRASDAAKTIRATVITGVAAANPAPPAYTAETDFPLAWIWVPSGFNPAVNTILAVDVHDDRTFRRQGIGTDGSLENLMHNSEFLAYSGHAVGSVAPEGWRLLNAPVTIVGAAPLSSQLRGRSIRITDNDTKGISTQLRVAPGVYTIKGSLSITSGRVAVSVDGVGHTFRRTGAVTEFTIRQTITTNTLAINVYCDTNGTDFYLGQIMVVQGYVPGNFRNKHETIMLAYPLADAAWTATAKSTGTTLIDMAASFTAMLAATQPVRGLIVRMRGNDSGSAANTCGIDISSTVASDALSQLALKGTVNDRVRERIGYAPMVGGLGNTFNVTVTASGANTLDATLEILGIIT